MRTGQVADAAENMKLPGFESFSLIPHRGMQVEMSLKAATFTIPHNGGVQESTEALLRFHLFSDADKDGILRDYRLEQRMLV